MKPYRQRASFMGRVEFLLLLSFKCFNSVSLLNTWLSQLPGFGLFCYCFCCYFVCKFWLTSNCTVFVLSVLCLPSFLILVIYFLLFHILYFWTELAGGFTVFCFLVFVIFGFLTLFYLIRV